MKPVTIGLIREGRIPPDKRVAFTPAQVEEIMQRFPHVQIVIQKSPVRCYADSEFEALDIPAVDNMNSCDIVMGIKEVQMPELLANKTYLFFSHTLKKQPHNKNLLQGYRCQCSRHKVHSLSLSSIPNFDITA